MRGLPAMTYFIQHGNARGEQKIGNRHVVGAWQPSRRSPDAQLQIPADIAA